MAELLSYTLVRILTSGCPQGMYHPLLAPLTDLLHSNHIWSTFYICIVLFFLSPCSCSSAHIFFLYFTHTTHTRAHIRTIHSIEIQESFWHKLEQFVTPKLIRGAPVGEKTADVATFASRVSLFCSTLHNIINAEAKVCLHTLHRTSHHTYTRTHIHTNIHNTLSYILTHTCTNFSVA